MNVLYYKQNANVNIHFFKSVEKLKKLEIYLICIKTPDGKIRKKESFRPLLRSLEMILIKKSACLIYVKKRILTENHSIIISKTFTLFSIRS